MQDLTGFSQQGQSQDQGYNARITRLENRVTYLEESRNHEAAMLKMKEQAVQREAQSINSELAALRQFAKRLLNPSDLGFAVAFEVRNAARRALGLPEVKEYDL